MKNRSEKQAEHTELLVVVWQGKFPFLTEVHGRLNSSVFQLSKPCVTGTALKLKLFSLVSNRQTIT